jgi:HAE1 family hydrophobic/amphiphilic exporter-1
MSPLPRMENLGGTALFVRRPILAFVLNALIVLAGIAGLIGGEVRELPDVDQPVITVTTDFPGAAPETVDREVTAAIEAAASRVAGVRDISSSSRFGRSRVTIEFADSVDLDIAASDVRDVVARVRQNLPEGADDPLIVKADANADAILRIAVTSERRSAQDLGRIVEDRVVDRLLAIDGVADVQVFGSRSEVFRIDVDLAQLASRGLSLADVRAAVRDVAFDAPAGALASESQSILVRTTAAIATPEAFEALAIAEGVRLGDVAAVALGPAPGESVLRADGATGVGIGIIRAARGNTLRVSADVNAAIAALRPALPDDVDLFVTSDDATFIEGSIREVSLTLVIAVVIVAAMIWLFLRDLRATLIPAVAMPIALLGTLAAIWLAGFSINILTLLALVLATGLVVDDAIVVLENIVRRQAERMGLRAAAVIGTRQVVFAVISTTATLAAVFIPLSFLPGQTGGLFREFGFTLAISVLLSSVVALTLCPMLASRILRETRPTPARRGMLDRLGERLAAGYGVLLSACLAAPLVVLAGAAIFAAAAVVTWAGLRQELTPAEDRAVVLLRVATPQAVSFEYTEAKMREIEALIEPMRASGDVAHVFSITGTGGATNRGFVVVTLARWAERARSQQEIAADINARLRGIVGVQAFAIQPNSLRIRGAGQGLTFAVTGSNYEVLGEAAAALVARMQENPAFGLVRLGYDTTQPQLFVEVDRQRATDLGIAVEGVGEAFQAVLDGRSVGQVFVDDRSFDIKLLASATPVDDPTDLEGIFMRAADGAMIPVASFVTLEERAVAPELGREGQMRAVEISAGLGPAMSLGAAWAEVGRLAGDVLPEGSTLVPLAEAATLDAAQAGLAITFGFAALVVLLVLAAQFESFVSALIVMATVPLGLACAVFALKLTGGSLNVYSQIGLVLLVGIMAKNGILIVEFADQRRDEGRDVRSAITEAAATRLRPVVMTMASTVLGGVPLVLSAGAGAEAREALGWVIVGGLGMAAAATLFVTPVAYLLLAGLGDPRGAEGERLRRELADAAGASPRGRTG